MNILVIAPHPDDESIGCGGTICLHGKHAHRVSVVFLTSGELGLKALPCAEARQIREREAEAAAEVLGIASLTFLRFPDWYVGEQIDAAAAALRPILEMEMPQRVYLPHIHEWHPDHQAALPIMRAALADSMFPLPSLLTYEVWTPLAHYDDGEDITSVMSQKLKAVRCHRSQTRQFRYDRAVQGLNQYRGALAWKCAFAEVFLHESAGETSVDPNAT